MKILAVNGSPRGKQSNSAAMLDAFLQGVGPSCEIVSVDLADKDIRSCRGCYSCWKTGKCVMDDDFHAIIAQAEGADLIAFATPVYFENVSGLFKNFIDRLTSTGSPHAEVRLGAPKFVVLANCGFPSEQQFEIVSLWFRHLVANMQSELLGEFYFPNGKRLRDASDETAQAYLRYLKKRGAAIAGSLGDESAIRQ